MYIYLFIYLFQIETLFKFSQSTFQVFCSFCAWEIAEVLDNGMGNRAVNAKVQENSLVWVLTARKCKYVLSRTIIGS